MKNKANYSIVKMTFEIENPNRKKNKVLYNKKIKTVIRVEDSEKVQNSFEDFVDSIEKNQHELIQESKNSFRNLFKSLWNSIRGYSKASESAYYKILRS